LYHKLNVGIALMISLILILSIASLYKKLDLENSKAETVWYEYQGVELLAILENTLVVEEEDEISQTITEDLPDYTKMYPDLYTVYQMPKQMDLGKKIAYLTFDDGPSDNTFDILDILQEKDVPATFFILGSAITDEGEACLRRMANEGHTIGIHTYSHMCNEIYCSIERYLDDFNTVYQQIYEITGRRVSIYRFPWGSNNGYSKEIKEALMDEMERRGFICYDWNVSANDSVGKPTAYSILHNIEKDLEQHNYPIILMHDSVINDLTARVLPDIIEMIREKGYEFDTLDHREPYQFPW